MNEKVRLENVIDTRTGQFYSIVIVKKRLARFFVSAEISSDRSE